jgi:Na+/H+-dicarboxylate symporter
LSPIANGTLRNLTVRSLAGLAIGLVLGIAIQRTSPAWGATVLSIAEVVIRAWTNAFRVLVVPLVAAQLFLGLTMGREDKRHLGRVGAITPLVFGGLLLGTALLSWWLTQALMQLPVLDSLSLVPAGGVPQAVEPGAGGAAWVDDFIPSNLFAALGGDNILPVMLFTLGFAVAARRLATPSLELLRGGFSAVGDAMFILVDWLLVLTPVVIIALATRSAATSGLEVGRVMIAFTVIEIIVMLVVLAAMYPTVVLAGGVALTRFARSLFPAQLTAAATRSSLATIPALLSTTPTLGRPDSAIPYVVPLAGALLKLSRAVSGPVKLIFLASVVGVPLSVERILVFSITIILLSATTVGVPRVTSGSRSLPAYVAAGIPAEYVVLLGATTMVTDIFMTVLNTSGYLTAGVIVDRWSSVARESGHPEPAQRAKDLASEH